MEQDLVRTPNVLLHPEIWIGGTLWSNHLIAKEHFGSRSPALPDC